MDNKDYVEEEIRFLASGKEVRLRFQPSKLPAYRLAQLLCWRNLARPDIFQDYFIGRIKPIIEDSLARSLVLDKKPDKHERAEFRRSVNLSLEVIRNNAGNIMRRLVKAETKDRSLEYLTKKEGGGLSSRARGDHNRAVFNLRLQRYISGLVSSAGFQAVVADYELVRAIAADSRRFPELEKLCSSPLRQFMTMRRIRYMDEESQRQEGLLAIWSCAKNYEGRNFARFASMARTALENKFKNLIEFYGAHKRRVHKFTSAMGSATNPKESILARKTDELAFQAWERTQRIQLSDKAREDAPYDPFFTLPLLGEYGFGTNPNKTWQAVLDIGREEGLEELEYEKFPHLNEGTVKRMRPFDLYDRKKKKAQWEYLEKWQKGECYVDSEGILRVKNPSAILQEMERGEDLDEKFKRPDGTYKDTPEVRKRKNFGLIDMLVQKGEDMTFEDMAYNLEKCGWVFSFSSGRLNDEWNIARSELIGAVNREYPGALVDDYPLVLRRADLTESVIPEPIKRLYVKCFVLSQSEAGVELYSGSGNLARSQELPF